MSEESLAKLRDIGSGSGIDGAHIRNILHVSPCMGVLVVEATIIYMLANQFNGCLIPPLVNLNTRNHVMLK